MDNIYIPPFLLDGIVISNRILHFSSIDVYVLLNVRIYDPPPPSSDDLFTPRRFYGRDGEGVREWARGGRGGV